MPSYNFLAQTLLGILISSSVRKVNGQQKYTWEGYTLHYPVEGGGGYSLKFQIDVCQPEFKTLTLLNEETNENLHPI